MFIIGRAFASLSSIITSAFSWLPESPKSFSTRRLAATRAITSHHHPVSLLTGSRRHLPTPISTRPNTSNQHHRWRWNILRHRRPALLSTAHIQIRRLDHRRRHRLPLRPSPNNLLLGHRRSHPSPRCSHHQGLERLRRERTSRFQVSDGEEATDGRGSDWRVAEGEELSSHLLGGAVWRVGAADQTETS